MRFIDPIQIEKNLPPDWEDKVKQAWAYVEDKTTAALEKAQAEGKSSGGTVFAGTTSQAIGKAVDRIVSHLKRHR